MSGSASASALFVEVRDSVSVAAIDPRLRLAASLLFLCLLPLLSGPWPLGAVVLAGLGAVVWARLPWPLVLKRLAVAEGFLVALLLTLPFVVPGTSMFSVLGLSASVEGAQRALAIVVRINAAVLVVSALVGGLGGAGLAAAMAGIGVPARLAHMLLLTLRYVGLFHAEYARLRRAMRARGFRPASTRHAWRSLGNLLGMLLVRSLERAERVRMAMLCRGFRGRLPMRPQAPLGRRDAVFAASAALVMATLVALEVLT